MSENSSSDKFSLHLPGLLKVLAEHMYSDRRVGIRELIQNAHDSCSRRKFEEADPSYVPRIQIKINPENNRLEISDNGCGLTEEEVRKYLATIGRGYTRELREETAFSDEETYRELIGQFGLGFLSAFLVAASVEVQTLSFKPNSRPICWRSSGDENYQLSQGSRHEVGTLVSLECKPSMRFLLDIDVIKRLVIKYCDFLPFAICVGEDDYPSNSQIEPWNLEPLEDAIRDYLSSNQGSAPIWAIRLNDSVAKVDHDQVQVPLSGVLYVPNGSVASMREFGESTVYIRKMFICEENKTLLPKWARFVCGIIDSPMLQPTASREDIHGDENLELIQDAIESQLLDGLDRLSREDPKRWNHLVTVHSDLIMGWATTNEKFFSRIADQIRVRTSRGMLTLPDYLSQTQSNTIYYQTDRKSSLLEQVLLEGRNIPVIDASWFGTVPFLDAYASTHAGLNTSEVSSDLATLIQEKNISAFEKLLEHFQREGIPAKMAEFAPPALPAVTVFSPYAEFVDSAESALGNDELLPGISELIGTYVQQLIAKGETTQCQTYLNATSPLIQKLAKQADSGELEPSICVLIYEATRIFSGRMLNAKNCTQSFERFSESIERTLR